MRRQNGDESLLKFGETSVSWLVGQMKTLKNQSLRFVNLRVRLSDSALIPTTKQHLKSTFNVIAASQINGLYWARQRLKGLATYLN